MVALPIKLALEYKKQLVLMYHFFRIYCIIFLVDIFLLMKLSFFKKFWLCFLRKEAFVIQFVDVTKKYRNGTVALDHVSLRIEEGEFVFVVGSSGSGKSTFLKSITREEVPTSGKIFIANEDISKLPARKVPFLRRKMGIVFQDFRLIKNMNVFDNVAFAMRATGASEKEIKNRVPYILALVGLACKERSMPTQLSGGEQQRVGLSRALVNNPKLIIADEPTGNIDPDMSYEILELLNEINKMGTTILMVTHEHELVKKFGKRVVEINKGKIRQRKLKVF